MKRLAGTLAGIGASLAGIALWVGLSFVGFIAGIAGALMGLGFYFVYRRINKADNSKYPVIIASILIPIEILISEIIVIAIRAGSFGVSIGFVFSADETLLRMVLIDFAVGIIFSYAVFIGFMLSARRRSQVAANTRFNTGNSPYPPPPYPPPPFNNDPYSNGNGFNVPPQNINGNGFNPVNAPYNQPPPPYAAENGGDNENQNAAKSTIVCKFCAAEIEDASTFCPNCGSKLQ